MAAELGRRPADRKADWPPAATAGSEDIARRMACAKQKTSTLALGTRALGLVPETYSALSARSPEAKAQLLGRERESFSMMRFLGRLRYPVR